MMSRSCPFHSFQLPLHVPDIFSVYPRMSRSCVASHFPTSPVVPIGFLVLCFPFIPPALPLFSFLSLSCPFQFRFVSLSFPVAFLSGRLPISSPHFLALPCISPLLPSISRKKNHGFPAFSQEHVQKHSFSRFPAKGGRKPKPAKEPAGGVEPGTLFCDPPRRLRLVERHQIVRYVGGHPPQKKKNCVSDVGPGGG